MSKETLKILTALSAPLLALSARCDEGPVPVGSIVDKEYQPEQTWTLSYGRTAVDDADHILRIESCGEGQTEQCQTIALFVSKELFDRTRVGDFVNFKYNKDVSPRDTLSIEK